MEAPQQEQEMAMLSVGVQQRQEKRVQASRSDLSTLGGLVRDYREINTHLLQRRDHLSAAIHAHSQPVDSLCASSSAGSARALLPPTEALVDLASEQAPLEAAEAMMHAPVEIGGRDQEVESLMLKLSASLQAILQTTGSIPGSSSASAVAPTAQAQAFQQGAFLTASASAFSGQEAVIGDEAPSVVPFEFLAVQPCEEHVPLPPKLLERALPAGGRGRGDVENSPEAPSFAEDSMATDGHALPQEIAGRPGGLREIAPGTTTLVVRNIPTRYAHVHLLGEWTDHASFDFLYRPYSLALGRNLGHAIINFVSPEAAIAFQQQWHRKRLSNHGRSRALDIAMSDVQGYRALLVRFGPRIAAINNPAILPVVLRNGAALDARLEARLAMASQWQ